jgi:hypothetical protein
MDKKIAAAQVNASYTRTCGRRRPTSNSTSWAWFPAWLQRVEEYG